MLFRLIKLVGILCLLPILASAQPEILDRVVAQVGGESILQSEIEEYYKMEQNQKAKVTESFKCTILENLLLQGLLTNQAKIDSVIVSPDMVENQLNARIERVLAYMNNDVSFFEQHYGMSVNEMKEDLREDLKNQMLAEEMRNKVVEHISVTPAEVKSFFRSIPYDSLPYFNSEVEYGELNFYPKTNKTERQKVIDKLTNIRNRIVEDGEKFEDLARKFSIDGSAATGGDLGWAKRGSFVPEFEAAAFNLEPGQVSSIVESEFGYHIIQLLERRGNSFHARHILLKTELSESDKKAAFQELDSITNLINTKSITFSDAVRKWGNKNYPSYSNGGRAINPSTNTTFFEIAELEPDIYFTLDTMDIDQISAPIKFKDPYGEEAFKVVQLLSRSVPHKASLEKDFSRMKEAAIVQKRESEVDKWIKQKITETYIHILPEYLETCPQLKTWTASN